MAKELALERLQPKFYQLKNKSIVDTEITTIDPSSLEIPKLHGYLLAAVAPRPIAFASTVDKDGKVNLSPFSFFNVFSSNPPVMIFSPNRRARDNSTKHTYENIKEVPEVVINIVNYPIVEQVSLSSTEYEKGVDEFIKSGLTKVQSETVRPPRVLESPVSFECKVNEVIELGDQGGAGSLILSEITRIHLQNKFLKSDGTLDTTKMDLVGRMGENWYCRSSGSALFEIPKPIQTKGIGVDQLPEHIRTSSILTGNNIARLGNLESLPSSEEIENAKEMVKSSNLDVNDHFQSIHSFARGYIEKGESNLALAILMTV